MLFRSGKGDISLSANTISNNTSPGGLGGGAWLYGGTSGDIILDGNTFYNNSAKGGSGGVGIDSSVGGDVRLSNNSIDQNHATGNSCCIGGKGGGVWITADNDVTLLNNIITGNTVDAGYTYYGGGVSISADFINFINNTITGNRGGTGDGLFLNLNSNYNHTAEIYNNIIWGNGYDSDGDMYLDGAGIYNVFNNNYDPAEVDGWSITSQGNNLNVDPLFVNAPSDDYHLAGNSSLINQGNNSAPYLPDEDYEYESRISAGVTDIGADEYIIVSEISVEPQYHDFGNIGIGNSSSEDIIVTNNGTSSLTINSVSTPTVTFSFAPDSCSGQTLPPSGNCTITVDFAPATEGTATDTFTISSTDTGNPDVIVYLSGETVTTIKGTVIDSDTGFPIDNALITVTDYQGDDYEAWTDSDGEYNISGFAEGAFAISITKVFYDNYNYDGSILAGEIQSHNAQMTRTVIAPPSLSVDITSPADGIELYSSPVTVSGYLNNMTGSGGYGESWAQSFKPTTSGPLDGVSLMLRRIGTPDDNLSVSITTEIGGVPIAVSNPESSGAIDDVSYTWRTFNFVSPVNVTAGNTYYIELWRENRDDINYIEWFKINGDYYLDGKMFHREDSVWGSNHTKDFTFQVYINSILDIVQDYYSTGVQPELYGFASDPVTVYVKGIGATVINNTFSASVPLNEGPNTIIASAYQGTQNASDNISVTLNSQGIITGVVTDSYTGFYLESVAVSVTDSLNNTQNTLTAVDGTYTITGIAPGSFSGSITKVGYVDYNFSGTASAGQTNSIDTALNHVPPVISNINVTNITDDAATITWTTDQLSDSLVDYGTTTLYESVASDLALTTSHSITLAGLSQGTLYHFMLTSTTNKNVSASSGDNTFTTTSPITITIVSPADNDTINRADTLVKGTVTNSTGNETGVTVNGIVAVVYNGEFFVNHVPLQDGQNTITADAVDTADNTSSHSILVNADTTMPHVTLRANIESGIAPLTTYFSVSTSIPNSVTTYDFDYEGDAVVDYTGATFDDISVEFSTEGIYYPTITVTDDPTFKEQVQQQRLRLGFYNPDISWVCC